MTLILSSAARIRGLPTMWGFGLLGLQGFHCKATTATILREKKWWVSFLLDDDKSLPNPFLIKDGETHETNYLPRN